MRHTQILVSALVRAPLLTVERADDFMRDAVAAADMSIIGGPFSVIGIIPGNEGVSSVGRAVLMSDAILDYSSVALHEWPDHEPYALVKFCLYTCSTPPVVDRFRALFDRLDPVTFQAAVVDLDQLLSEFNPSVT